MMDEKAGMLDGLRILVVEDESLVAMMLQDMLETLHVEVAGPVRSAEEALREIAGGTPDLVTLDVNLGDAHCYQTATELKARNIPFVFISGYDDLPDCPAELADAPRLRKPFRLDELSAVLAAALHKHSTF